MISVPEYHAPATIEETFDLLHRLAPKATLLAGGQDVVPMMNQGRLSPEHLVDLKALRHLRAISATDGVVRIGALATHRMLEHSEVIKTSVGLLAEAAAQIGGGVQVRNRGTVGGSVCAGNAVYDLPPCLLALDAEFVLARGGGERRVFAPGFLIGGSRTAAQPEELLVEIKVVPLDPAAGFAYEKLTFTDGCYNIASAACIIEVEPDGTVRRVRVAVGGVLPVPVRLRDLERWLPGARMSAMLIEEIRPRVEATIRDPISDVMADGAYRQAMAAVMTQRAVARAARRAQIRHGGGIP